MELTKTEQQVIKNLIWHSATARQKELILEELNFTDITEMPEQEMAQTSFAFDEAKKEKPLLELIPNVERARRAMHYAVDNGINLDILAVMCNAHINWPGTKRDTKPKSMQQLMTTGYNFSHGKWSPYLSEARCIVIIDLINKMFPAWGKSEGITPESIATELANASVEDDPENGDSL